MEKSYAKLLRRIWHVTEANAVAVAVGNLRRHSCRNVICSLCVNDQDRLFEVTDVDSVTGSITEVKCKRCKETNYVCHGKCFFQRSSTQTGFESSYKQQLQERTVLHNRKSIRICNVMDATVTLLRRHTNGNMICSCGNNDPNQLKVTGVDRFGFITSVECSVCQQALAFSPLEASYVVQMLYHRQSDQEAADTLQEVLNGDHVEYIDDVCSFLRRHSFYENSICPEFDSNDKECCRVTAINKTSGKVMEVEFDSRNETSQKVQRLQMTCRSGCYYDQYSSPSQYESTYKAEMRAHLQTRETNRRELINESRTCIKESILSCTVLAANAIILRRHNTDNKLCLKCRNDNHNSLKVIEIDEYGFITRVQCTDCGQLMSTACYHSHFHYEEIDGSVTLERGDHISWHRNLAYWHHAVVTDTNDKTVTIAHYESSGCSVTFQKSTRSRQDIPTSLLRGIPYRITYHDCYTNEYSALRAEQFVGEKPFNPINRNCEHSSNWCRTGLSQSDQMMTCFSSVGKGLLAFCLRILNMLLLMLFQVIHEDREGFQMDRKAFEFFEHIVISSYMAVVFVLFTIWSMYTECKKLKPTSAHKHCCSRPRGVACGLFIRIFFREVCAALGPFLLIWFEDHMLTQLAMWKKMVTASFTLLGVTIVSYVLGAVIGTLLEYVIKLCRSKCSTEGEQIMGYSVGEITNQENFGTNDSPSTSLVHN